MSSDNEEDDLNYGINDDYAKSFGQKNQSDDIEDTDDENKKNLDFSNVNNISDSKQDDDCIPKYEKNPKLKPVNDQPDDEQNDNPDCGLEDLLNLIEQENNEDELDESKSDEERKKIFLKKGSTPSQQTTNEINQTQSPIAQSKSSITITRVPKEPNVTNCTGQEVILTEKNTGSRLIKSTFKNDIDLNMRLACDFGKFLKLTDINRRSAELKESKEFKWYSIFLLASKTESKCSAKGNNYVIWKLVDLNNIDKQQDISLFLFGNAYKTHWKSNEFEVFALIQPDILDSNNNNNKPNPQQNQQTSNSYFNNGSPFNSGNKGKAQNGNWNKFAAKKVDLNNKLSLSVKADYQLISLGFSKDITACQSLKSNNEANQVSGDNGKRCKNLVNLQEAPFCIYHCKQLDNNTKFGADINKGKYSMNKPTNRFGTANLFESTIKSATDVTFLPNNEFLRNKFVQKAAELDTKKKVSKEIKAEILNSLTSSIKDSPLMAQIAVKTSKKTDSEILACLNGKELNKDEVNKLRLAEQATVKHYSSGTTEVQKGISKLFNSKILLPSESTCNNTISSKRIHEYKQLQTQALSDESGGLIKVSPFDYSAKLKEKYHENKKNYNLSTMGSHKDIVKQMKESSKAGKTDKADEIKPTTVTAQAAPPKVNKIIASDFLAKRMNEIKKSQQSSPKPSQENKKSAGFDLELYIGDSLTTKKLLDVSSKHIPFSPSTATSNGYKRKLDELKQTSPCSPSQTKACLTPDDKSAKKAKLIDEILNIKSNHLKEVNDPDKNPHMKAYFNKLEQQESIDNKLCSVRNREIRAVTCKVCSYTSFSQSDYCKKQNHVVARHMSIQRYFKCKICNKRTYTLDKLCPISACSQCGNEKFEPCTMKQEDTSICKTNDNLNQESEMLLAN